MKKIMSVAGVFIFAILLSGCSLAEENDDTAKLSAITGESIAETPMRTAEINGVISSMEGNNLVIKNEIGLPVLSAEESAQKKAERQKLSQEERQALKAQETANVTVQDVSVQIPVGKTILKGTGDASGNSIKATFDDLKKGVYVSIWMRDGVVEVVKIKGL